MAQEKPGRISEWAHAVREHLPELGEKLRHGAHVVRENPGIVLHHPGFRYGVYAVAALVLLWGASWAADAIAPPKPAGVTEGPALLDYRVICTNADCGYEFVLKRERGFRSFPVECVKCKQKTGRHAQLCTSSTCKSRWVVPDVRDGMRLCPYCREPLD